LTLFAEDSHAKTSASQEKAQDLKAKDQVSGQSSKGSSKKSNRGMQSLKTSQPFDLEDWIKCSGKSLRSGMMRNGIVSPLPVLVRLTDGIESGLWRTPETIQGGTVSQEVLEEMAKGNWKRESGHQRQLRLQDQVRHPKLYPTPRANSAMATKLTPKVASHPHRNLEVVIAREIWPTPTVQDGGKATKRWREDHQNNLTAAVFNPQKMFPTPTSRDWKGGYRTESLVRKDGKSRAMDALPNAVLDGAGVETVSGHLNPAWVEWLMGFPVGWTDLNN